MDKTAPFTLLCIAEEKQNYLCSSTVKLLPTWISYTKNINNHSLFRSLADEGHVPLVSVLKINISPGLFKSDVKADKVEGNCQKKPTTGSSIELIICHYMSRNVSLLTFSGAENNNGIKRTHGSWTWFGFCLWRFLYSSCFCWRKVFYPSSFLTVNNSIWQNLLKKSKMLKGQVMNIEYELKVLQKAWTCCGFKMDVRWTMLKALKWETKRKYIFVMKGEKAPTAGSAFPVVDAAKQYPLCLHSKPGDPAVAMATCMYFPSRNGCDRFPLSLTRRDTRTQRYREWLNVTKVRV